MAMASTVDETPSTNLTVSVMRELDMIDGGPPQDEYAELPPAYDNFEHAYSSWCTADQAKQDIAAIDADPAFAAAEKVLKEAKEALGEVKKRSEEAFKALHPKRSLFASFFSLGKSKRKSSDVDAQDIGGSTTTTIARIPSTADSQASEEFKRAYEAQLKQDRLVQDLEERVAGFNRKKEALSKVASGGNFAWIQLRRIAEETLSSTPDVALGMGAAMEKLENVENAYNTAKKTTTDLTRARLAVQNSHRYFTSALEICDGVRGTATGRAVLGSLGGGIGEMDKIVVYRQSVIQASKAQICLNEVFRILEPREHMIPEYLMDDYKELKKRGVMQMSKVYNLLFGGRSLPSGVAGSVKLMLDRQEAAFAHLTRLAVWIQDCVPVCVTEEQVASTLRDGVRREVAVFLYANINHG